VAILIDFGDVRKMLENCAPGSTWRMANHSRVITYNGRVYRSLPKFDELEAGYIRKLVRHLQINEECAKKFVGQALIKKQRPATASD
jgi:hypothetical protein